MGPKSRDYKKKTFPELFQRGSLTDGGQDGGDVVVVAGGVDQPVDLLEERRQLGPVGRVHFDVQDADGEGARQEAQPQLLGVQLDLLVDRRLQAVHPLHEPPEPANQDRSKSEGTSERHPVIKKDIRRVDKEVAHRLGPQEQDATKMAESTVESGYIIHPRTGWMIKPVGPNSSSKCQLYCANQPNSMMSSCSAARR